MFSAQKWLYNGAIFWNFSVLTLLFFLYLSSFVFSIFGALLRFALPGSLFLVCRLSPACDRLQLKVVILFCISSLRLPPWLLLSVVVLLAFLSLPAVRLASVSLPFYAALCFGAPPGVFLSSGSHWLRSGLSAIFPLLLSLLWLPFVRWSWLWLSSASFHKPAAIVLVGLLFSFLATVNTHFTLQS